MCTFWTQDEIALTQGLAFYGDDEVAKAKLVEEVRKCCLVNGFFQIVGHRVPLELQEKVLQWVKDFFAQDQETKDSVHKGGNYNQLMPMRLLIPRRLQHMESRLRTPWLTDSRERHEPRSQRGLLHRRGDLNRSSLLRWQEAQQRTQCMARDHAQCG